MLFSSIQCCLFSVVDPVESIVNDSTLQSNRRKSSYHCCVPRCNGDSRYDRTLKFHRLPGRQKDAQVQKEWLVKIRRDEGPHFKVSDFPIKSFSFSATSLLKSIVFFQILYCNISNIFIFPHLDNF